MEIFFYLLSKHRLCAAPLKFHFYLTRLPLPRHVFPPEDIETDDKRLITVACRPQPTTFEQNLMFVLHQILLQLHSQLRIHLCFLKSTCQEKTYLELDIVHDRYRFSSSENALQPFFVLNETFLKSSLFFDGMLTSVLSLRTMLLISPLVELLYKKSGEYGAPSPP